MRPTNLGDAGNRLVIENRSRKEKESTGGEPLWQYRRGKVANAIKVALGA